MEPELRRNCQNVEGRMYHQGAHVFVPIGKIPYYCCFQSVFLGDITKAYEKTPNLESLLFDDFFNRG